MFLDDNKRTGDNKQTSDNERTNDNKSYRLLEYKSNNKLSEEIKYNSEAPKGDNNPVIQLYNNISN